MIYGLGIASIGAMLAWARSGFIFGFTEPKIILIVVGMALAFYFRSDRPINQRLTLAAAIYAFCYIPSVVGSVDFGMSLFGYPGIFSGSVLTTALCISGLLLASSAENPRWLEKAIMCSGAVMAVHAAMQHFGVDPFRIGPLPDGNSAVSTVGSRIDLGAMMVALLSFSHNPIYLVGVWASRSRGAWLGSAVTFLPGKFRAFGFIAAFVIGMAGILRSPEARDTFRPDIWRVATMRMSAFGTGPSTFEKTFTANRKPGETRRQAHAHNAILEAYSTRGLVGVIGMAAFLFAPEMAGLWTVASFNPISFECVFVACVLLGFHRRAELEMEA